MPMPAVKFPSEPPPTAASSSFQLTCCAIAYSFLVETGDAGIALHRHSIDAALDAYLAMFVERLQSAQLAVERSGLRGLLDAHIDRDCCFGRDNVGPGPPSDHSGIHREALLQVIQLRDRSDLPCHFEDGAVSLAGVEAGMRSHTSDRDNVFADTLARGLYGTAWPRGFEHEHRSGFSGQAFGNFAGRITADFFV